nr:DUF502 domain-containing protein [Thalassobacillus sp. C254]
MPRNGLRFSGLFCWSTLEKAYILGFLTGESKGEVQRLTNKECINVFLPTTPNPTSGWLVLVPKEDVKILEMTVEQGLKFIISGGVVVPPDPETPQRDTYVEEDLKNKRLVINVKGKKERRNRDE